LHSKNAYKKYKINLFYFQALSPRITLEIPLYPYYPSIKTLSQIILLTRSLGYSLLKAVLQQRVFVGLGFEI